MRTPACYVRKSRFVPLVTSGTSPQLHWYQSYPNAVSGTHIIRVVVDEISLHRLDCLRQTMGRLRRWLISSHLLRSWRAPRLMSQPRSQQAQYLYPRPQKCTSMLGKCEDYLVISTALNPTSRNDVEVPSLERDKSTTVVYRTVLRMNCYGSRWKSSRERRNFELQIVFLSFPKTFHRRLQAHGPTPLT